MGGRSSALQDDAGFTLVELLVVLTVMALVLTAIPLAYQGIVPRAQLRDATAVVVSHLKQARLTAMEEGRVVSLPFENGDPLPAPLPQVSDDMPDEDTVRYIPFESSDSSTNPGTTILTFHPDGGSSGGTLDLSHGDLSTQITVDWLTGRVRAL